MTDAWRRYLAAAQVAGGVAGFFGLRLWQALGADALPRAAAALAALYFALSVAAGLLLWRRHPAGVPLSLSVQLPQVVVAVGPEANVLLLAGAYIRVLLPGSGFGVGAGVGGLFDATLLTGPVARHVGMSLDIAFRQYLRRGEEFRAYGVNVLALMGAWKLARAWVAEPVAVPRQGSSAAESSAPIV